MTLQYIAARGDKISIFNELESSIKKNQYLCSDQVRFKLTAMVAQGKDRPEKVRKMRIDVQQSTDRRQIDYTVGCRLMVDEL